MLARKTLFALGLALLGASTGLLGAGCSTAAPDEDADDPPHIDSGEAVLQAHGATDSVRISANRRGFTLRATQKRATNGTIVVCDTGNRVRPKALVVSYTGRPRVTLQNRRGEPYDCAD